MRIEPTDPESAGARALIALSDAYMTALYPPESNHFESASALKAPNVLFLGCFLQDQLVGCGAVKILSNDGQYGELKRVFVLESHRGKGYSKAIMEKLESHLKTNGNRAGAPGNRNQPARGSRPLQATRLCRARAVWCIRCGPPERIHGKAARHRIIVA